MNCSSSLLQTPVVNVITYAVVVVPTSLAHISFADWERCGITVTSWYLENTRGRGCGCSLCNFLSFHRHINMPIATSRPNSTMMDFSYSLEWKASRSAVIKEKEPVFACFISKCLHSTEHWFSTKIEKVQETAIKSTALIMQICFICTVITTDKDPQGVMTDVSVWL